MFPPRDNGGDTKVRAILNLIGVFLIHLPSRPLLYFGNLAVYVPSYVVVHTGQLTTHIIREDLLIANNNNNNNTNNYNSININNSSILQNGSYYSLLANNSSSIFSSSNTSRVVTAPESEHGIQESWFVPVFSTAWMFGTFLSGVLATYIRTRFVIGLGIIFQSGSLFVSYFTINVSESTFFVMLCICIGFGAGLYEGLLLKNYVVVSLGKRTGTITSLVLSSGPLGGVVINQFITWYTNPDNLSPDVKMGEMRIFSQQSIQDRIPSMFLILGSTMLGLTLIGYFMLKERKLVTSDIVVVEVSDKNISGSKISSDSDSKCRSLEDENCKGFDKCLLVDGKIDVCDNIVGVNSSEKNASLISAKANGRNNALTDFEIEITVDDSDSPALNRAGKTPSFPGDNKYDRKCEINKQDGCGTNRCEDNLDNESWNHDQAILCTKEDHESESKGSADHMNIIATTPISIVMTPLELLKSADFYKLAVVYIFGSSARLFLSVYYKIYGQEWINDDHFLTNLAAAMSFLAVFTTVIWGLVLDKIGLKLCFIVIYTGISIFFLLMYFCAQLDRWAYFFVTLFNSSFVNYLYPVFTIALIKWFGREYLSAKLGIAEIFSTAGYYLATFVLAELMETFGFLSGFIWTSSVHFVGLIIIVLTFPKAQNKNLVT